MKLNIIIPTFNRDKSLRKTLSSLAAARLPENFQIEVTVVDNNSVADTKRIVEEMQPQFTDIKLEYLFEKKQGRSFALNTGIKAADGEILSGIDDDEEIDENWFVEVERIFRERWNEIDFVDGKLLPNWETDALAAENQPVLFAGYFYGRNLSDSWLDKPLQIFAKRFFNSAER